MKTNLPQNTPQPLIFGNINALNLLASNATGTNNSVVAGNLMAMPLSGTENQVIGILPLIIERSQMAGGLDSSQAIHSNNYLNKDDSLNRIPSSQPLYNTTSIQLQSNLVSADTLILTSTAPTLASADTIPLSSSGVFRSKHPIMCERVQSKQRSTSIESTFSLVSDLSNRSVNLDSIPTINLFKPEQDNGIVELVIKETLKNSKTENKSVRSLSQSSSSLKINVPSVGYQTRSKSKRKTSESESETNELQIDEDRDTDTEADGAFTYGGEGEKKENSLTRDDTVIITTTSQSITPTQTDSSLAESDTLIISSNNSRMNLEPESVVASSARVPLVLGNSNNIPNTTMSVAGNNSTTHPPMPSVPSIPSLVLSDSMVEGSINPTLLCQLLSQSSESSLRIQPLSLDQFASSEGLSLVASIQNSIQGVLPSVSLHNSTQGPVVVSLQNPSQGQPVVVSLQGDTSQGVSPNAFFQTSSQGVSSNTPLQNYNQEIHPTVASNRSVKGTQTDWVFGNSSVSLVQNPLQIVENNGNVQSVGQVPVADALHVVDVGNDEQAQPDKELPFPCASCELKFPFKEELKKHEKDAHKKIYECDFCTSTFTRVGNYTRHRKIHALRPGEKYNTCKECGRNFLQRCDLKRHMLIHSNQQPYRCEICKKGYIRHNDLVVHMRFHNKEKNFKCNLCDKKYFQSGDLSRHVRRTHKPSSQLTCGHCQRKYACEVTLIRHMKLVHKDIIQNTVNQIAENV